MKRNSYLPIVIVIAGLLLLPASVVAQSNGNDTPLGDVARALRKNKRAPEPEHAVIDNDNLSKVVDEVASQRAKGNVKFAVEGIGKDFQVSPPDVTCSLSFNGEDSGQSTDLSGPQDLPSSEIAKLDGPASLDGDTLQVSVYNGTAWKIKEITVGLTILRRSGSTAAKFGSARLLPASAEGETEAEKRPDLTVLYHLKGTAAPFSSALFRQVLGVNLSSDQEWHWAIVQARGTPPQ